MSDPTGPDLERLRALDGQPVVTAHQTLTEDVDGAPLGVETVPDDDTPAMFVLPAHLRADDDEDEDEPEEAP